MFQSLFVTWNFVGGVEDAAHRTDARNCAQRHRPVAFAAEGLRLALCFAINRGIRIQIALMVWGKAPRYPNDLSVWWSSED